MLGLLTAPLLLSGVVVLGEGRGGCPSAGAVSARLEELLGDDGGRVPDALIFDGEAGALRVRLLSPEGALREEKVLELHGSCDELADAVATLGVTWRSRLQGDEVPPPVLQDRPVLQVFDDDAAAALPATVEVPAPAPADFELTLGLQTASGIERWAPGLLFGLQLPVLGRFHFALTLDLSVPRTTEPVGGRAGAVQGSWTWVQGRVVAGPFARAVTRNLYVDGQVGLGAGVDVTLNPSSSVSSRYHRASPSLVSGARWTYRRARGLPWFGVTFTLYLDPQLDSPVRNTNVAAERWVLGVALGGTLAFNAGEAER